MDVKQLLLLFVHRQKLESALHMVCQNLNDLRIWSDKIPGFCSTVKDTFEWINTHADWEDNIAKRLCLLADLQELLSKEGFDRWEKSPDDGGIPF
jgi:hypothetical protein